MRRTSIGSSTARPDHPKQSSLSIGRILVRHRRASRANLAKKAEPVDGERPSSRAEGMLEPATLKTLRSAMRAYTIANWTLSPRRDARIPSTTMDRARDPRPLWPQKSLRLESRRGTEVALPSTRLSRRASSGYDPQVLEGRAATDAATSRPADSSPLLISALPRAVSIPRPRHDGYGETLTLESATITS